MPPLSNQTVLQLAVESGLLNIWVVRARSLTNFRRGVAGTLKEEFAEYGLPEAIRYFVGALKAAMLFMSVGVLLRV